MKIIVTGATGLIGKKLTAKLLERGDEVTVFTRSVNKAKEKMKATHFVEWNPMNISAWINHIEDKDAIINLAGENIMNRRWNEEHKKNIFQSRLIATRALVNAMYHVQNKPSVFISASAIGYYGFTGDELITEELKPGTDFLAILTQKWEREAIDAEYLGVRRVSLRIGIVLDKTEGALAKMLTPFKFFVGGPIGTGQQWFSWIHIDDLVKFILFSLDNKQIKGSFNLTSPKPVRMYEFAATLGKILNRPCLFRVPALILKIILGEGAEYLLHGSKVIPAKTLATRFEFDFTNVEDALMDLLK